METVDPRGRWTPAQREIHPLRPGFTRNTGAKPRIADDRRVVVALMSGELAGDVPLSSTTSPGWLVKTTRWSLTGWWHDIDQWKRL